MKTSVLSKQNFITLVLLTFFAVSATILQAQSELEFRNSSYISGSGNNGAGSLNAIYRFPQVNSNLDALVRISDRSSSSVRLTNVDLTNTGFGKAFQPQISYNNGSTNNSTSWWMEFEITFVNTNTSIPASVNEFDVTAIDIDGDNNNLYEWVSFYGLNTYTLENNSMLQVSTLMQLVSNVLQPVGKTFTGTTNQYSGIDTTNTGIMTTLNYSNRNSFRMRIGSTTSGGGASNTERMFSFWFRSFNYTNPLTLPVKLVSFTAALNQNQSKVDLKWTTASEINVSHFVVEKSYDGKNFSDAGLVFAFGNTTEKVNYSFTDNIGNAQHTVIYYRLRSADNDGKTEYSEIRIVRISKQSEALKMITYPNPVSSELRITVPSTWQGKAIVLEVFNQNGQKVKTLKSGSSSQTETIMVNDLARGMYLLKANCGTETAQQKIIKD